MAKKQKRPLDLKYTESHEWIRVVDKTAIIGITDYAVKQLSDLVHLELPEEAEELEQDSPFGEIESVKTVADLIAPAGGKITAVNEAVVKNLDVLHEDPYEEGWLIKLKLSDPKEIEDLMSAKEYDAYLKSLDAGDEEEEAKPGVKMKNDDEEEGDEDDDAGKDEET